MRFALRFLRPTPFQRIATFTPRRLASSASSPKRTLRNGNELVSEQPSSSLEPPNLDATKTKDLVASFAEFMDLVKEQPKLDGGKFQVPSQPKIAENIVRFLFERRLFEEAVDMYRRMLDDGILPSPSTDALFLAISLAASKAPAQDQLEGFQTILAYSSFTEPHFLELLDHIATLNIPPDTAARLTRLFISVKGDEYHPSRLLLGRLIDLQAQAGHIMAAADTIAKYNFDARSDSPFDTVAEPYAVAIRAASDQAAVDWIMGVMREKDVPIHITVFNALISRQRHSKDLRKAFAFYGVIIRVAATTPLRPNANTYKHLFRLLGFQYKKDYRPNFSRRHQQPGTVPPPRQFFADMMLLWFSAKFHPPPSDVPSLRQSQMEMDKGLLTLAFRTFLYLDDYPAALVVLRAISDLGLRITEREYFILTRYMARKTYYDVYVARARARTSDTKPVFAFELLGEFKYYKVDQNSGLLYRWVVKRLLARNSERTEKEGEEDEDEMPPKATWRGRIPTFDEILGQDTKLSGDRLDHYPLVSILRRAMRAHASTSDEAWGEEWRKRTVTKARHEMIPKGVELFKWPETKKK
ncbi:hypothetical protein B0H11DRAFT_2031165 [Mycena galericulata]|nr:hypothetical protein B0H11DRAFT_2031165 [Mycena galericulata]